MNIVLGLQSYPGANEVVKLFWPWYEKGDFKEIIGIGTSNGSTWFPPGIRTELIGADLYIQGSHLPSRLIRTIEHLMLLNSDWLAVAEYDVVFCQPIPRNLPLGLTAHLAGGKPAGCRCNFFVHGPWICDRLTAMEIIRVGNEILAAKEADPSPDCFLGQVAEVAQLRLHTDILKSYSRNTIDSYEWITEARAARLNGAVSIHGVKSSQVLEEIMR